MIQHLTGCRFLLSLWIVCNHFVPKEPETALNHVVSRSNVAVSTFVCMSGFITHWAYGERELSSKWKVLHFFVKRIGRVAFTTWTAMVAAIVVMAITGNTSGDVYDVGHVCRCFTFVETWLHPRIWCPNGQTWTVAALIPSWLMYPWSRRIIAAVQRRAAGPGLLMLAVGAWALEFGAIFATYVAQGFWLSLDQHYLTYTWPPSQLLDFFIGATVAALAKHHSKAALAAAAEGGAGGTAGDSRELRARSLSALFTDGGAAAIVLICCAVPNDGEYRTGAEVLYNHGVIPFIACFLYGGPLSTPPPVDMPRLPRRSLVAQLLRQPALVGLGTYSFQVFLFQWPVHTAVTAAYGTTEAAEVFVAFCLCLWISAGLFAEFAEQPFVTWLHRRTADWTTRGHSRDGRQNGVIDVVIASPAQLTATTELTTTGTATPTATSPLLTKAVNQQPKRSPLAAAASHSMTGARRYT